MVAASRSSARDTEGGTLVKVINLTQEAAALTLKRYRHLAECDVLFIKAPRTGRLLAVVFGVDAAAGVMGEADFHYAFGAVPASALTRGKPRLLLDLSLEAPRRTARLSFPPVAAGMLLESEALLLLAAKRPAWLRSGDLMDTATFVSLSARGGIALDLRDAAARRELVSLALPVLLSEAVAQALEGRVRH